MPENTILGSGNRRTFLKTVGGLGIAGLAGCTGGVGGGGSGEWPPDRNIVEWQVPFDAGAGIGSIMGAVWTDAASEYYGEDVSTTVTYRPAGGGVPIYNNLMDSDRVGLLGSYQDVSMLVNQIVRDDADYDATQFRHVLRMAADVRCLALNPKTVPGVDGHFTITWDEMCDYAQDEGLQIPYVVPQQRLNGLLLREFEPRLDEDNFQLVYSPDGGEARNANLRGDVDGYFGGFSGNFITRNQYYFVQFVSINPETQPEVLESRRTVQPEMDQGDFHPDEGKWLPDHAVLYNTSFPTEGAVKHAGITGMEAGAALPPGVSDDIYDRHVEVYEQAAEDESVKNRLTEAFGVGGYSPLVGDQVNQSIQDKWDSMNEEEIRSIIENIFTE